MQATTRLGLLIGSSRIGGNGAGMAAWLAQLLDNRLNAPGAAHAVDIEPIDPHAPPHPPAVPSAPEGGRTRRRAGGRRAKAARA